MQQNDFILEDLNISAKQKMDFLENNINSLTNEQLKKIPDVLDGKILSNYQKTALAMGKRIDFAKPKAQDELDTSFHLTGENKISMFYASGETNIIKISDVGFEIDNALLKQNAARASLMPWENNETGEQEPRHHISR